MQEEYNKENFNDAITFSKLSSPWCQVPGLASL